MYRIIYFMDQGEEFGGAVNTLLHQAFLAKDAGQEVEVVFSNSYGNIIIDKYVKICSLNNVEITYLPYKYTSHTEGVDVLSVLEDYDIVKRYIQIKKPDILHSVQINPVVELISRELNIPHIMNVYQALPAFFNIKYMDIFPHYHICDSWFWANVWKDNLNTDSVCIRTVAKIPDIQRTKIRDNEIIRFLCVGTVFKEKNQLNVIQGFEKALQQGVKGHLTIYGYDCDPYAVACKKYTIEHKIESYITFAGFCVDMVSEYQKNDVLICGSVRESYPNVISEAMANGVIVLSTPVAGVPEVIKDHENGYLTVDYTAESICNKIIELDQDRKNGCLDIVFRNACETYQSIHTPRVVTDKLMHYYQYVVRQGAFPKSVCLETLKKTFDDIICVYSKNKESFYRPDIVGEKLWYLYHIRSIVRKKRDKQAEFYIWGSARTGKYIKEMLDVFIPDIQIVGYIDSFKNGECIGYPIYKPAEILHHRNNVIFIAVGGNPHNQREVIEELEKAGKVCNDDYFILARRAW